MISIMFKTVSESCNLSCDYCYYSRNRGNPSKIRYPDPKALEKLIDDYMHKTRGFASFIWQGGEPLLAGIDFFELAVYLEAKYAPQKTKISNSIQTNGTLLNDRWAKFFRDYNFFVGVSLDGPVEIHDSRRVTSNGLGSFNEALRGVKFLEKYGVEYNILTVLHRGNIGRVRELMDFYEENDFKWIQFLPAMKFHSQFPEEVGEYEISPEEYGDFLRAVFDRWYSTVINEGLPRYSIRFIDSILSTYLGGDPGLCVISEKCSDTLIVEQNGDVFPCDFFMGNQWKLGNISLHTLDDLLRNKRYIKFMSLKPDLPEKCASCKWKSKCYGGCPRNRKYTAGKSDPDYFCKAYIKFYEYAEERMKHIVNLFVRT